MRNGIIDINGTSYNLLTG